MVSNISIKFGKRGVQIPSEWIKPNVGKSSYCNCCEAGTSRGNAPKSTGFLNFLSPVATESDSFSSIDSLMDSSLPTESPLMTPLNSPSSSSSSPHEGLEVLPIQCEKALEKDFDIGIRQGSPKQSDFEDSWDFLFKDFEKVSPVSPISVSSVNSVETSQQEGIGVMKSPEHRYRPIIPVIEMKPVRPILRPVRRFMHTKCYAYRKANKSIFLTKEVLPAAMNKNSSDANGEGMKPQRPKRSLKNKFHKNEPPAVATNSANDTTNPDMIHSIQKKVLNNWMSAPSEVLKIGRSNEHQNTNEYFVQEILDVKYRKDETMFLIKWFGWIDEYNSWVQKDDLLEEDGSTGPLLSQFLKKRNEEGLRKNDYKFLVDPAFDKTTFWCP